MKKDLHVKIEEDVLIKAKNQIPNLSKFVEDSLKVYLGLDNNMSEELKDIKLKQLVNEIDNIKLEIHYLTKSATNNKKKEKRLNHTKDMAWRFVWASYSDFKHYSWEDMDKAEDILEKDEEEIVEIMDLLLEYDKKDDRECLFWNNVLKIYDELK